MRIITFKLIFIAVLMFTFMACSSDSDSDNGGSASLDGELTVETTAPQGSGFFLTVATWDGNNGDFTSETITIPQSGRHIFEIENGNYEGVEITLGPIGEIESVRLSLLSDGEVIAETETPVSDGAYMLTVGSIPDF